MHYKLVHNIIIGLCDNAEQDFSSVIPVNRGEPGVINPATRYISNTSTYVYVGLLQACFNKQQF